MNNSRQTGYTFIELSIVIVILGLVAMLVAFFYPSFKNLGMQASVVRNQQEVREALLGFAFTYGRLPYADTDNDGVENDGQATGHFPYRTVGLSAPLRNAEGLDYEYGVYLRPDPSNPQNDADLGHHVSAANLNVDKDRFWPMIADGLELAHNPPNPAQVPGHYFNWGSGAPPENDSVITPAPSGSRPSTARRQLGYTNQLDFCKALDVAQQYPGETTSLHVVSGLLGGTKENVAYLLVDPGAADMNVNGNVFDGANGTGLGFEHPTHAATLIYDDKVMVGYFSDVWERMGCAGLLSASGHAHPNVQSTTAQLRQSLQDTKYQVRLMYDMAAADELQAIASQASAVAALATAIANMSTSVASAINTAGVTSGAAVSDGIAIGLASLAVAEAAVNLGLSVNNVNTVYGQLVSLEGLINNLESLHNGVTIDVNHSDRDAFSNQ